jgi:hypothetical protein
MSKRVCIFCGGGPLTREHIFARWIQGKAPDRDPKPGSVTFHTPGNAREEFFEAPPLERTAKVVCSSCNSGWMSELESEAAKVLVPLFVGWSGRLDGDDLTVLTRWALKTAFVIDAASLSAGGPMTPRADRYAFRETLVPPAMTAVWLTTWPGTATSWTAHWGLEVREGEDAASVGPNTYGATIAIYPIVLRTYVTNAPSVHPNHFRDTVPGVSRIWPVAGPLDWEAKFWLTARQLEEFAFGIPRAIEGDRDETGFWRGEDPGPLRGPLWGGPR